MINAKGIADSTYERDAEGFVFNAYFCGNFRAPWLQYRKTLAGEAVFAGA